MDNLNNSWKELGLTDNGRQELNELREAVIIGADAVSLFPRMTKKVTAKVLQY